MNNYILYAILILTGLLGTYAIIPLFRSLLIESNVLRPNYKKDMIQAPFGEGHGEKINSEIANNTIIAKAGRYVSLISAENATQIENKILNIIKK